MAATRAKSVRAKSVKAAAAQLDLGETDALKRNSVSAVVSATAARGKPARIVGAPIPPLLPAAGDVRVLIVGEAPGPRGADKSGFPFFGDAAGKHLYLAMRRLSAVDLPDSIDGVKWDGSLLRAAGFAPKANLVSLTNAFDRCPTDDGHKFRAPTKEELEGDENASRLRNEISSLQKRGLSGIVTLGKVATRTMQFVVDKYFASAVPIFALPHPSAQGLLSMAPNRGKGARLADLQESWMQQCMEAIRDAGFDGASTEGR